MKLWDDELRICPKCKATFKFLAEPKQECPKCGAVVWFYNYRQQPTPTPVPPEFRPSLLQDPATLALLAIGCISVLVTLIGVYSLSVVVALSGMAVVSVVVFAILRHIDARRAEAHVESAQAWQAHTEVLNQRVKELVSRYNSLLRTGDTRIEKYYRDIYGWAEQERANAERLLESARREHAAVQSVEDRIYAIAERFVTDHLKWSTQKLRADPENYQRRKHELEKAFAFAEKVGYPVPSEIRNNALAKLKADYAAVVREATLKEEQRRIQQQMREEERLRREADREVQEAEAREREIEDRLEEALRSHKGVMDAEVQALREQLADAQARAERAKSMAQLTKAGHVYILSNIGSFGENMYKVGMTRRLDPNDRVRELGDASVPFPFDVHAMITCEDAPGLEHALHRRLTRYRVNRVNLRKEFFQVELNVILDTVRQHHGHIDYVAEPEALQYRESLEISPESLMELETELESLGVTFEEEE